MDVNVYYAGDNQITSFDGRCITLKNTKYVNNVIITNDNIIDIDIKSVSDITEKFILEYVVKPKPDIVLFGSGNNIVAPHKNVLHLLHQNNIGVEVMAIGPLCRTFNFLLSEDRKIIAIILFD